MSAIHTGSITARLRADGLYEYTGTSTDHPVTGWENTATAQDIRALIPTQRAGNAYEQVVLSPDDDLADLGDFADIPQLGSFVRELRRAEQNAKGARP